MEVLVRPGLLIDVRTSVFQSRAITIMEAKSVAYLFKCKKELFTKNNHIFELRMSDQSYWFSLKYASQVK